MCVSQIHLSFSLEMSERDGEEAKKATERNVILRMMLNLLLSFATIIGKTKDAELKYGVYKMLYQHYNAATVVFRFLRLQYFELEGEALTQQALIDRITKHYMQEVRKKDDISHLVHIGIYIYILQGVIQMYSVVLGLEVLGNPVGFVRGLKTGTVALFYHPIQVHLCTH